MRLLLALLGLAVIGVLGWSYRLSRRLRQSERDRRRAADELNRRLSELFSLQELSFILSGSLQLDRIVEQVVRYAMRFLDAQGALVALALDGEAAGGAGAGREDRPLLRVTAADGTLAELAGRAIGADDPGLLGRGADAAGGGRAGRLRGGGPAARPRRGGGNPRDREPARRRVCAGGRPPALHRGHARRHRDRQCALLRDGAAREGAMGNGIRLAERGHRGGGRFGTGASGEPLFRRDAAGSDRQCHRMRSGRSPGGCVAAPGGATYDGARGRPGAADRAALDHLGARDPRDRRPHSGAWRGGGGGGGGGARSERGGAGGGRDGPAGDGVPPDPECEARRRRPAR